MAFIFDSSKGETPDTIKRKRDLIRALMGTQRAPQNVGEGLNALGDGIVAAVLEHRAGKAEKAGLASADEAWGPIAALLAGGGGEAASPAASADSSPLVASPSDPNVGSTVDFARGEASNDFIRYANQGATRNKPLNEKLVSALSFLPELGVSMEVFSGGQDGKGEGLARLGSTRHDHGNAADVYFHKDGRRLDWGNAADLPIFEEIVRRGKAAGVTGWGAGPGYMRPGSMHLGFGSPSVWGAGGKGANAPDWLVRAYNAKQAAAAPAVEAVNKLASAEPVQVASLDPSAGLPSMGEDDARRGAMPAIASLLSGGASAPAEAAPAQTQIAQALSGGGGDIDINALMKAAGNEFMSPSRQAIIKMLMEQELQQRDPKYGLELENMRGQIEDRDIDNRREDARFGFEREKFGSEMGFNREKFVSEDADRKADNTREDKKVDLDERKFNRENLPEFYDAYVKQEIAAGRQPLGILEYETALKKSGASNVTTNVGSEKEYDKTIGKGFGEQFLELQNAGTSAQQTLSSLDVMEQMMSDPGFYSGTGAGAVAGLKRLGSSLGMDVEGIDSIETFNAMSKKAALDSMGGSLGTGFSNADRDFVTGQVPTLENTAQGNKKLIGIMRKLNERKMQIAELAGQYAEFNEGRIDAGFSRYLKKWADENPLFPKEEKAVKGDRPTKAIKDYSDEELEAIVNGR